MINEIAVVIDVNTDASSGVVSVYGSGGTTVAKYYRANKKKTKLSQEK